MTENGCWEWTGDRRPGGYGRIWFGRKRVETSHRYVYTELVGPIPEGLVLDHLCRNRICCNPAHLEPVSPAENNLRGLSPSAANAHKTHCVHGHKFSSENTGRTVEGERYCRACQRQWARIHYPEMRARYRAAHPIKPRVAKCALGHELVGENLRLTSTGKKTCWRCWRNEDSRRITQHDRNWQEYLGLDHIPTIEERLAKVAELPTKQCPLGHEYTLDNTRIERRRRFCRACHAEREARRRQVRLAGAAGQLAAEEDAWLLERAEGRERATWPSL